MLSYPDRRKFQEIRSRWEAAQVLGDTRQLRMVGRKEKPAAHQPLNSDDSTNASKFRRKLSHGLSFISLSQRRTTPVRPSLHSNDLTSAIDVPHPHGPTRLLSTMRSPSSRGSPVLRKVTLEKNASPQKNLDPDATPKQLLRSRTMSFIPRPSRSGSESSLIGSGLALMPRPAFILEHETRATPTKIPSPDPSAPARRKSSPREYHPSLTTQQAKHVAAGNAFARVKTQCSKPSPVRSYTTPNLVKATHQSGPNQFMTHRKPTQHRLSGVPTLQSPNKKENLTPVTHQDVKRLSNIQEHSPQSPRRENLMAPMIVSKSRLVGSANVLTQGKQGVCTTPPTSSKHKSSQSVYQTPLAAQRALPQKRSPLHAKGLLLAPNISAVTQTRLLGPVSPPTPATTDHAATQLPLVRANIEKDFRRCTFSTPYKRTGGVLARSQAGVNSEVRFPRSSTYHHFVGGLENAPPVPPIPEQYKNTSMPVLVSTNGTSKFAPIHHVETNARNQDFQKSLSYSSDSSAVMNLKSFGLGETQKANFNAAIHRSGKLLSMKSNSKINIQLPGSGRTFSASLLFSAKSSDVRSSKISQVLDIADIDFSPQVKDYMPALYWAGRFQSRYDQWRTEAIQVELDPDFSMAGPLAHCNVHQEKMAACHIFLQLRDLCLSHQAADSLWEFEHKYRQDHNLLGTSSDLPPLNSKPEDGSSKQGPFGRAIRKMTPRKSSFVNLLKGKGWNTEELKSMDGSVDCDLTSTKIFDSSEDDH